MGDDRLDDSVMGAFAPLIDPHQHRPIDDAAVRGVQLGGVLAGRIYVKAWGATETLKVSGTACQCIAIGPGSHHNQVLVKSSDSDRFMRVSTAAPVIYDFKPPLQIVPVVAIDSPLELMLFNRVPESFGATRRASTRRQWNNGALYGTRDESPLGFSTLFIGGRARWKVALFDNNPPHNLGIYLGVSVVQEQGFNPLATTLFRAGFPIVTTSAAIIGGQYISSEDFKGAADTLTILDLATSLPWTVAGLGSMLIMEAED